MQEHWLWKEGRLLDYSDDDLSHWELLVQDLPWPDGITLANIKAMKINEKVAIAYCVNVGDRFEGLPISTRERPFPRRRVFFQFQSLVIFLSHFTLFSCLILSLRYGKMSVLPISLYC